MVKLCFFVHGIGKYLRGRQKRKYFTARPPPNKKRKKTVTPFSHHQSVTTSLRRMSLFCLRQGNWDKGQSLRPTTYVDCVMALLLLFLTFSVLVANPRNVLRTVADPARGLLNREKRKIRGSLAAPPPPPPFPPTLFVRRK